LIFFFIKLKLTKMALTLPNDIWWLIYKNIEYEKKMEVKKNYKKNVVDIINDINEGIDRMWEEIEEEDKEEGEEKIGFYDYIFEIYFPWGYDG